MPTLKTNKVTHFQVDYHDLDNFINEVYDTKGYRCVLSEEWGNDSTHGMKLEKESMSEWDIKKLEEFKKSPSARNNILRVLMQDMVNRDLIEPGEYLIDVCW